MNALDELFHGKKKNILSIYFTAGFPKLNDTKIILTSLERSGVDMIEIGIPFSDPLADGPVIQHSSEVALRNGMTLDLLFSQLDRLKLKLPLVLMGYLNPVIQFGVENFCRRAKQSGISGVILPDLPIEQYLLHYRKIFEKYNLKNIFLITPQTEDSRIAMIDKYSTGFIYAVSSASTTGTKMGMDVEKEVFFRRIKKLNLKNAVMIGFGISDRKSFSAACRYANGAIIGSAFIRAIQAKSGLKNTIQKFVSEVRKY